MRKAALLEETRLQRQLVEHLLRSQLARQQQALGGLVIIPRQAPAPVRRRIGIRRSSVTTLKLLIATF